MPYQLSSTLGRKANPNAKALDGDRSKIRAVDGSRDGGLVVEPPQAMIRGRRVLPDHVPTKVQWKGGQYIRDFESVIHLSVSARMRELIDAIEPETHQFLPVTFSAKNGVTKEERFFWVICNRLDAVHRDHTNYQLDGGVIWRGDQVENPRMVFERAKIEGHHFWWDKHLFIGPFLSTFAGDELRKAKLTGFGLIEREAA